MGNSDEPTNQINTGLIKPLLKTGKQRESGICHIKLRGTNKQRIFMMIRIT